MQLNNFIQKYKWDILLLVSGLCFVIIITLTFCSSLDFWMDESWDTAVAWSWINLGKFGNPTYPLDKLDEVFFLHPPLPIILESILIRFFGITPWVIKFWPITMGILSLLFFYLLAKELFQNVKIAIFGTIYLAFIPLYPIMMFQFRPEIFVLFFTILAVYLIVLAEKRQNMKFYFWAGVSSALSFLCHFYGGFLIGAVGLYLIIEWFKQKNPNILKFLLFFILGVAIIVVPYFIWVLKHWEIFKVQYFGNLNNLTELSRFFNSIFQEKQRYLISPKRLSFILFTIIGLMFCRKKFLKEPFLLYLIYLIVFIFGLALMPNKTIIYFTPIIFITSLVAICLLKGEITIKNNTLCLLLSRIAVVGSLIMYAMYLISYPAFYNYIRYSELIKFNQIMNDNHNGGNIISDPTYFLFLPQELKQTLISQDVLFRWLEESKFVTPIEVLKKNNISILVYTDSWWRNTCANRNEQDVCLMLDSILNDYGKIIGTVKREKCPIDDYVYKLNISNL